jgi:hypothetical protein
VSEASHDHVRWLRLGCGLEITDGDVRPTGYGVPDEWVIAELGDRVEPQFAAGERGAQEAEGA